VEVDAANYPGGQQQDPRGPDEGINRASRGGSWHPFGPQNNCQVTDRRTFGATTRNNFMGFRVVTAAP